MYSKEITKEYLIKLGITDVTKDGFHVFKNGVELKQFFSPTNRSKFRYLCVALYDPDLRKSVPPEKRKNGTGRITIGVHVLNYVWNRGPRLEGFVVDHLDNCQLNNNIDNLQLITPAENSRKDKSTRMLKCKLNKPLSFYENKLKHYEFCYELAKKQKDAKKCRALRANLSNTRAKIRYWKAHHKEEITEVSSDAQKQAFVNKCFEEGKTYNETLELFSKEFE